MVGQLLPDRAKDKRADFNLAKLKKFGTTFEVVLKNPEAALEFRHGKNIDLRDVLDTPKVFEDVQKAEIHGSGKLRELLKGKTDEAKLAKMSDHDLVIESSKLILREGEIALTQEMRKKFFEAKRKKIMEYIHANAADPKTGLPHPMQRLELAMEQARVQVDPYQPAEAQIEKIIQLLRPIIPITFERAKIRVLIPAAFSSSVYSAIKNKFELQKEDWKDDGSVSFELEVPAGVKGEVINLIQKLTQGEASIEDVKK